MYSYIGLCCFLVSLAGCHGYYFGSTQRQCYDAFKPCRMRVSMRHLNGSDAGHLTSTGCRCSRVRDCPSDWSNSGHAVTLSLMSDTYTSTMHMMFCTSVQPQRRCRIGETALIMSGAMAIPTTLSSYRCACDDNQALRLSQRSIGEDHLTYERYVCANHQPTCPNYIARCMELHQNHVNYDCKCSGSLRCRVDPYADPNTYPTAGYCRS